MHKYLIIETCNDKQNFYYLTLPSVSENDFYRQTMSFNAFFNGKHQFTASCEDEIGMRKKFFGDTIDWDNLQTLLHLVRRS